MHQLLHLKRLSSLINPASREAVVSPGHLPAHCSLAIRSPLLFIYIHLIRILPKLLGDLIPNSGELNFDPMLLSNHRILSLILPALRAGILINNLSPSHSHTLTDTLPRTLEHQLPYPMPESDHLGDQHWSKQIWM